MNAQRPPKTPRPWPAPRAALGGVGLTAEEARARWSAGRATPWVDPLPEHVVVAEGFPLSHGTVADEVATRRVLFTFCWHDPEAEEVLLWVNRLTDETRLAETLMERLPGTDLWVASFAMPADWRASYCVLPRRSGEPAPWGTGDHVALRAVLDRGQRDPQNPLVNCNRAGALQSVVEGPGAPSDPWPAPLANDVTGSLEAYEVEGRTLWVHQPRDADARTPLPLLVVLDGETWIEHQRLPSWLEGGYAAGAVPAHRTVFLASGGLDQRWRDLGRGGDGVDELCEVVVPWARERFATPPGAESVTVAGQSLGGLAALRAVVERPEVVGRALSQSASLWLGAPPVETDRSRARGRVHLSYGAQEWVLAGPHEALAPALCDAGLDVRFGSHQGGHDYAWWRNALLEGLVWLQGSAAPQS